MSLSCTSLSSQYSSAADQRVLPFHHQRKTAALCTLPLIGLVTGVPTTGFVPPKLQPPTSTSSCLQKQLRGDNQQTQNIRPQQRENTKKTTKSSHLVFLPDTFYTACRVANYNRFKHSPSTQDNSRVPPRNKVNWGTSPYEGIAGPTVSLGIL